ncbi:MAG: Ig-like domain-containing protein [Chitinophagales bacterium]
MDQFIYQLCDVDGEHTAIVNITINSVDDQPIANADNNSTNRYTDNKCNSMMIHGGHLTTAVQCTTTDNGQVQCDFNGR